MGDVTTFMSNIKPFDIHSEPNTVGTRWRRWTGRFDTYLTAAAIANDGRKKAQLLFLAGEAVEDLYNTIKPHDADDNYAATKQRLTEHFDPQVNVEYDIFVFRGTKQEKGETTDQYCSRLRTLSRNCNFHNVEAELKSQIIQHGLSSQVRRRGLREPDLALADILNYARTLERSEAQAKGMEA